MRKIRKDKSENKKQKEKDIRGINCEELSR